MLRNPDRTISSAEDMVAVIETGLEKAMAGDSSCKYAFVHLEVVSAFERNTNVVSFPIKGIRKLHSFTCLPNTGGILASTLSCLNCTVAELCLACKEESPTVTARALSQKFREAQEVVDTSAQSDESDSEASFDHGQESDGSVSDAGSNDSAAENTTSDFDEDSVEIGSVVWVKWGRRFYPARVVLAATVPEQQRSSLSGPGIDNSRLVFVKFYGEESYGRADRLALHPLGTTAQDLRWSRLTGMSERYMQALADQKYSG